MHNYLTVKKFAEILDILKSNGFQANDESEQEVLDLFEEAATLWHLQRIKLSDKEYQALLLLNEEATDRQIQDTLGLNSLRTAEEIVVELRRKFNAPNRKSLVYQLREAGMLKTPSHTKLMMGRRTTKNWLTLHQHTLKEVTQADSQS